MVKVAGGSDKWVIETDMGRKIEVSAPYITDAEAKIISAVLDALLDYLTTKCKFNVSIDLTKGSGSISITCSG